ncbi:MAG: PAS domain S-box protein [Syntrophaceae bacterium]|nr:PAS domain S-box protein [Syntrophaceae bacterium]
MHKKKSKSSNIVNQRTTSKEKKLHDENLFRIITEQSPDIIFVTNKESVILYVNPAIEKYLGLKADDMIGSVRFDLIHPDDLIPIRNASNILFSDINAPVKQTEVRLRHKDGSWRTFDAVASKIMHNDVIEKIIVNLRDITEHKKIEDRLRNYSEQLKSINENLAEGMVYQINSGKNGNLRDFTYLSTAVERLHGLKMEEAIHNSKLIYKQIIEEDIISLIEAEANAFRNKAKLNIEVRVRMPSGEIKWRQFLAVPHTNANGDLIWDGIEIDITEHKKAEEKLLKSEKKFASIFHLHPNPMAISDVITQKFIDVNNAYTCWTGYSREELIGVSVQDLHLWVNQEDREKINATLAMDGEVNDIEIMVRQKNSNIRNVLFSARFIEIEQERYLLSLAQDITESRKIEEELRESEAKLRKIFEGSNDGIFLFDMENMKYIIYNQAFLNMLGYTGDELKALTVQDIHPREELPLAFKQIQLLKEGKEAAGHHTVFKKKDGSFCFADISTSIIEVSGKNYILAINKDITEQMKMEEELRKDKMSLEQKNIALTELLEHIERTKNQIKEDIAINIEGSIIPVLEKLQLKNVSPEYLAVLRRHLNELTSPFGRAIAQRSTKLSSKEIEICNLIKGGLNTKEISGLLNVSSLTVAKHRRNIRTKLNISGKDKSLTAYLKSI